MVWHINTQGYNNPHKSTGTIQWWVGERKRALQLQHNRFTYSSVHISSDYNIPKVSCTFQLKVILLFLLLDRYYLFSNHIAWHWSQFSIWNFSIGKSIIQTTQVYNMQLFLITDHMPSNNRWQILTSGVILFNHLFMQSGFKSMIAVDCVMVSELKFHSLFIHLGFSGWVPADWLQCKT